MDKIFTIKNILIYLIAINLISFLTMYIDKKKAKWGKWRVKESTLFTLALIGGSIGSIAGMHLFRHKTKKTRFVIGFPAVLIIQIIVAIIIIIEVNS